MGSSLSVQDDIPIQCYVTVWTAGKQFSVATKYLSPQESVEFSLGKVWYDVHFEFSDGCDAWKTVYLGGDTSIALSSVHPVSAARESVFAVEHHATYLQTVELFSVESAFKKTAGEVLSPEHLAAYTASGGSPLDPLYKALEWLNLSGIALKEPRASIGSNGTVTVQDDFNYCNACQHLCKNGNKNFCKDCKKYHTSGKF